MLLIFDLDGTLLNTIDDLARAANYALRTCGFATRSVEECRQFVGNGVSKLLERALPEKSRTPQNMADMRAAFFAHYNEHLIDHTYPYPGIQKLLACLQAGGVKLGVCSNKYQQATTHLIDYFFPKIKFSAVLGQREGLALKPDPQMIEEILHLVQEPKEHCLYVGDSEVDMQTAQNAHVKCCGVTWGFRSRQNLAVYQPAYLVDNPVQILLLPEIQRNNQCA